MTKKQAPLLLVPVLTPMQKLMFRGSGCPCCSSGSRGGGRSVGMAAAVIMAAAARCPSV